MSYPEARYHGESGEVTAGLRRAGQPPDLVYPSGNTVDYLATGATTDGLFGLFRWNMGPEPSGPRPHFHRTMAESFYVLVGRVKFFDGREWVDGEPSDFLHVPPGGIHAFRNEFGAASMLIQFAPGAPRETYFEAGARMAATGRPTDEEMEAFYAAHDQFHV